MNPALLDNTRDDTRRAPEPYRSPLWLRGGHLQTIIPALLGEPEAPPFRRERWETPDGDFIDLDWVDAGQADAPLLAVFHGLEGSSQSRYARALTREAALRGWRAAVVHFRGCSGELNRAPRFYHSGDSGELDWVLRRLHELFPLAVLHAVGVSLGGNALLKWLGERGGEALPLLRSAVSISAPLDLAAGGRALSSGSNMIYTRMFLRSLKQKSLLKLQQFPGLFDREDMLAARDLHAFDNVVTAPLHGFRDTDDYWKRASSKPLLAGIRVPTLVLNALNDPFLPASALPSPRDASPMVKLEFPEHGGHVGFWSGRDARGSQWLPRRTFEFLERQV